MIQPNTLRNPIIQHPDHLYKNVPPSSVPAVEPSYHGCSNPQPHFPEYQAGDPPPYLLQPGAHGASQLSLLPPPPVAQRTGLLLQGAAAKVTSPS